MSKNPFEPRYPASVSGKSFRAPLYDEVLEVVAARLDRAYRMEVLPEGVREMLLRHHSDLGALDTPMAWRPHGGGEGGPVPPTDRPVRWTDASAKAVAAHNAAWLRRVWRWLDKVEGRIDPLPARIEDGGER